MEQNLELSNGAVKLDVFQHLKLGVQNKDKNCKCDNSIDKKFYCIPCKISCCTKCTLEEHKMHFEECSIDEKNAEIINRTIEEGGRIISVGTTSTRTLESMAGMPMQPFVLKKKEESAGSSDSEPAKKYGANKMFRVRSGSASTGIFIYPGYEFKIVDALITNFHLPKSTLIMLVSALYDREEILKAYNIAVEEKYRFFSYGDAMLIQ